LESSIIASLFPFPCCALSECSLVVLVCSVAWTIKAACAGKCIVLVHFQAREVHGVMRSEHDGAKSMRITVPYVAHLCTRAADWRNACLVKQQFRSCRLLVPYRALAL